MTKFKMWRGLRSKINSKRGGFPPPNPRSDRPFTYRRRPDFLYYPLGFNQIQLSKREPNLAFLDLFGPQVVNVHIPSGGFRLDFGDRTLRSYHHTGTVAKFRRRNLCVNILATRREQANEVQSRPALLVR